MNKFYDVEKEKFRANAKQAFKELRVQATDVPEMSLDEINEEIRGTREEHRKRIRRENSNR